MARRDLSAVWTVLESNLPDSGVEAVGIGYEIGAGELLAGVDDEGKRYLLIPLLPGEAARANTRGRAVHLSRLEHAGSRYLAVMCLLPELHTVFTQFSRELVVSIENAESPARAAAESFDRWKALFSDAAAQGSISEERLIGLIGELLTLQSLLERGAPQKLEYWWGPSGGAQDFRTTDHALEVKSTLVRDGRIVSISSIDQLHSAPGCSLYLVHHRLERDPAGFAIGELHQRLTALGASVSDLAAGFAENGLNANDLRAYDASRYRTAETRIYDCDGFAFPKITRASFLGGDTPPGTLRLSYSIDLTNEPPTQLSTGDTTGMLERFAEEASNALGS